MEELTPAFAQHDQHRATHKLVAELHSFVDQSNQHEVFGRDDGLDDL